MTFTVEHSYVDQDAPVSITRRDGFATVRCSASGSLPIRFPGKLRISRAATYSVSVRTEPGGGGRPWQTDTISLPLTLEIESPDGQPFTADHVTLDDLRKFRDLRGTSQGSWTFRVRGKSEPIAVDPQEVRVSAGKGHVRIGLDETVTSQSAPPLVNATLPGSSHRRFIFDLFRVGTFTATASTKSRVMNLLDPKGAVIATSRDGRLAHPITLETLGQSRDAEGKPRPWSLEVLPSPAASSGEDTTVWASVIEAARIRTRVLQDRIEFLIGEGGSKLSIYGEMQGSDLLARLKILDVYSAETIDMHGLLDSVIESEPQDEGVDKNITKDVAYTLASRSRDFGEMHVSLNEMKVSAISIAVGASETIQPAIPALKIDLRVEGDATVKIGGFPLATLKIRDNRIRLEAGVRLNPDGSFSGVTWIEKDRLDVDVHWAAALAAGVISGGLLALGAAWVAEVFESFFNVEVTGRFHSVFKGIADKVPQVLAVILGGDFTYRSLRLDGDDVVFDYIAPLEPETKPTPSKRYVAIIGRTVLEPGPTWLFRPLSLGDTWKAQNLNKVDHIIVVMMENRSFDHVLGYRAQLPGGEASDGLTAELATFLASKGFPVRKLSESGIVANDLGLKTRFPAHVGHKLADVAEQLSIRTTLSGREINDPKGFLDNFTTRAASRPELKVEDVLGYYEADDLPFFKFLAENYSYCESYFSSHAGPTLPNRMLFLTGDVQYDRAGEAILDNNNGDNFSLSRAPTIFDVLTRKGVGWRVYESEPSVTMLRMFARYSTDNTNIVPLSRLRQDVAQGNLLAVTIVEPAMHHHPPNDDHPVADMYHGQLFLKDVYDILRSNEVLWRKTMLVITYDEHGGFYDHVVPPMAEARQRPSVATENPTTPGSSAHFTPSPLITGYGLRVPTFVVSPWSPIGKGPDIILDHCSILKTIVARFCGQDKPFVSDRVNASRSFDAYLSEGEPRMNVPDSPTMSPLPVEPRQRGRSIDTDPVSRKQMQSGNVDYHELTGMLARMLGR